MNWYARTLIDADDDDRDRLGRRTRRYRRLSMERERRKRKEIQTSSSIDILEAFRRRVEVPVGSFSREFQQTHHGERDTNRREDRSFDQERSRRNRKNRISPNKPRTSQEFDYEEDSEEVRQRDDLKIRKIYSREVDSNKQDQNYYVREISKVERRSIITTTTN